MKAHRFLTAALTALFAFAGTAAVAQDRPQNRDENRNDQSRQGHTQFDDKDRQATTDWYNQHKDHPPAGLREQDRLSTDEEARLHQGAVLDPELRKKVHNVPSDLKRRLPPPPSGHRYVAIGVHVALVDHGNQVKDVIHLHDNR